MKPTKGKLRVSIGQIKLEKTKINVGKFLNTEIIKDSIRFTNYYDNKVETSFITDSKSVTIYATPEILQPGETGFIIYEIGPSSVDEVGSFVEKIQIVFTKENSEKQGLLIIEGTMLEDFSLLKEEELKNAPEIWVRSKTVNFGTAKIGEKHIFTIDYINKGSRTLFIRNIKPSYGFVLENYTQEIAPGKTGHLSLSIEHKYALKKFTGSMKIYSNSPHDSELFIRIYGQIKK